MSLSNVLINCILVFIDFMLINKSTAILNETFLIILTILIIDSYFIVCESALYSVFNAAVKYLSIKNLILKQIITGTEIDHQI